MYKNFPLVISERWQAEVADTVFDTINHDYDKVEPKKKALRGAQEELDVVMTQLKAAQDKLQAVNDKDGQGGAEWALDLNSGGGGEEDGQRDHQARKGPCQVKDHQH